MQLKLARWLIILALVPSILIIPTSASASAYPSVSESGTVFIYGDVVTRDSLCWNGPGRSTLQAQNDSGRWVTLANSFKSRKDKRCKDPRFPYAYTYRFTVSELGRPVPDKNYYLLRLRELNSAGKAVKFFSKQTYATRDDWLNDLAGGICSIVTC